MTPVGNETDADFCTSKQALLLRGYARHCQVHNDHTYAKVVGVLDTNRISMTETYFKGSKELTQLSGH